MLAQCDKTTFLKLPGKYVVVETFGTRFLLTVESGEKIPM